VSDHYFEEAEEAAAKKGLVIVLPAENELFLDIDCAEDAAVFARHVQILGDEGILGNTVISSFKRAPSPSGKEGREHITVTLARPVAGAIERIALQTVLGSDRLHEALALTRALAGAEHPTVFFEKPETIDDLIARSSLGEPNALAIRATADPEAVARVLERVAELSK
jgi:hypothetical protein